MVAVTSFGHIRVDTLVRVAVSGRSRSRFLSLAKGLQPQLRGSYICIDK